MSGFFVGFGGAFRADPAGERAGACGVGDGGCGHGMPVVRPDTFILSRNTQKEGVGPFYVCIIPYLM